MAIIPKLQLLGTVTSTGTQSFAQFGIAMSRMSQEQLANILITNNQALGYNKLNSVQMYNALVQAGVSDKMAKATVKQVLQTQATNAQTTATVAATGATGGLTAALTGLGAVMKAHPIMTAFTVLSIVIPIVTALVDHFTTSAEELQAELNDVESDLSNINSELETTQSRIKDLESMDTLSLTEQEELDRLKIQNEYLETQLYLLKEREREIAKQTNKNVEMELGKSLAKGAGPSDVEVVGADDGGNEIITYAQRTTEDYYPIAIARLKELYAAKAEYADMSDDERKAFDQEIASLEAFIKSTATLYSTSAAQLNLADESAKQLYDDWMQLAKAGSDILQWYSPLGDINDSISSVTDDAADSIDDFSSLVKHLARDTDVLNTAISNLQSGNISAIFKEDNLDNLLDKFPDLVDELESYSKGLITSEQLQLAFNDAITDFNTDEIYDGINDIVDAASDYGAESNRVRQAVQNLGRTIPGFVDALYDQETGQLKVNAASLTSTTALYDLVDATIAAERAAKNSDMLHAVKELEKLRDAAIEAAGAYFALHGGVNDALLDKAEEYENQINEIITKYYDGIHDAIDAARKKFSESSTKSDQWLKAFEAEYDAHKHAVNMERETLTDFYAWLDSANQKYFANRTKYLDEYRKYAEKVFNGLRDLAEDSIDDGLHQITLWENQGGHEIAIVTRLRELQNELHATAEAARNAMRNAGWSEIEIENSDIVKELSEQWWSLNDQIKDVFESVSDTVKDYLNDIEHQIYLLEKEAGDTGENDAAILSKYASLEAYILKQIDTITDTMKSLGYTETQIANSGAIQELQKRLWDIRDSVKDIVDTLNDDLYDSMQALLDITIEMIRQEKEDEKDALETLIDDYSTIIAQRKEMLQLAERERSYHETVAEKTSEIAKIQARIDALSLDDSRAAAIERASLEEDLADLAKELADTQRDHTIDATEDQLDKELADFEDTQDKKIQAIEDFLNDQQSLNQAALNRLDSANQSLFNDLLSYALHYTSTTRAELEDMWNSALSAAQNYGSYVNAMNAAQTGSYYTGSNVGSGTSSSLPSVGALVEDLVSKMMANSAAWYTGDKAALANKNAEYAAKIAGLIGEDVVRGNDGVWYIGHVGGPKLYEDYKKYCYHTGGVVGNVPTLKQNEVLSLLNKGEVVLTATQQSNLMAILDQLKPLNALKEALTSFRSSALTPAAAGGPTFQIDAPVYVDGTLPDKQIMELLKSHSRDIANTVYSYLKKM